MGKEIEKIKDIIAESLVVDLDEITMDAGFVDDLGADSLGVIATLMDVEEAFDIEVSDKEAEGIVTVADLVRIVGSKIVRTGNE